MIEKIEKIHLKTTDELRAILDAVEKGGPGSGRRPGSGKSRAAASKQAMRVAREAHKKEPNPELKHSVAAHAYSKEMTRQGHNDLENRGTRNSREVQEYIDSPYFRDNLKKDDED